MSSIGFVSLVGAGPGDPDLLTLAALKRLDAADLVLHDALVAPEVLALARRALRVSVGKRSGARSTSQDSIHRLMIKAARRGLRVVRFKGGDPFVFGRGGEEALALVDAGIPFEVIPGVSSALAAPGLSGIPVTHRGLASAFVVVAGHAPSAYEKVLSDLRPNAATVVVLMGLGARTDIARLLLATGWSPDTPAAVCLAAGTSRSRTSVGRLADLGELGADADDDPGTLVIGEVVSLASVIGSRHGEEHEEPEEIERRHHVRVV